MAEYLPVGTIITQRRSFVQSKVNYVNAYCFAKFARCGAELHGLDLAKNHILYYTSSRIRCKPQSGKIGGKEKTMKSYVIHLIRNAPCEGNLEARYIGRTESPIAMEGIRLLLEQKQKYEYPEAEAFYASPSTRCVDSLKILYPEADPEVILEMAECDFGDWENKSAADLKDNMEFETWLQNGQQAAPPNGESGIVFMQRVCQGFEMLVNNLMREGKPTAALVTSGGVIMTILSMYGLPKANFYDWMCEPGCGYSVRITPGLWMRSMVMEVFAALPGGDEDEKSDHVMIDLAREAADRAYGQKDEEE
jgi:Fructose-2,6-bisphosphatase